MSASAKGKQQKQVRQLQCQEQCINHIPYYFSGLSRTHVFRQPFFKQLYIPRRFASRYIVTTIHLPWGIVVYYLQLFSVNCCNSSGFMKQKAFDSPVPDLLCARSEYCQSTTSLTKFRCKNYYNLFIETLLLNTTQ